MKPVRFATIATLAVLATALFAGVAPVANAAPQKAVNTTLATLWTSVLETPSSQNSFGTGDPQYACWDLGGTVAPFAPHGVKSCTVKPGTKLFVVGYTAECSTFEGNGTTEAELRTCARLNTPTGITVTLDGQPVPLTEAETPLLKVTLPADNIFGAPAGTQGLSVGYGWVASVDPLTPGTHTIEIHTGTLDPITTQIIVKPGS